MKKIRKILTKPEVVSPEQQEEVNDTKNAIVALVKKEMLEKHAINAKSNGLGYLGHHFAPTELPPKRFPDFLAFPTHLHTEKYDLVVPVSSDNKLLIYFCPSAPLGQTFVDYSNATNTAMSPTNTFLFYNGSGVLSSTAAGAGITIVNGLLLTTLTNVANVHSGIKNGTNLTSTRLLSAYIKLEYTGKPLETSGVIKAAMNIKTSSSLLATVAPALLQNSPLYSSFRADEDLMLQYRHLDESHYAMGPYASTINYPYILVYGESLASNASYKLTVVRNFESIVKENMAEITNPIKEPFDSGANSYIKDNYGALDSNPLATVKEYKQNVKKMLSLRPTGSGRSLKLPNDKKQLAKILTNANNNSQSKAMWRAKSDDWGYLLHLYMPTHMPARRFPDFLAFPTSTVSNKVELTVPLSSDGKFVVYWCPGASVITGSNVSLATNPTSAAIGTQIGGNCIDSANSTFLAPDLNVNLWANRQLSFASAANFTSARILSGYLEIEYIGKVLDAAGTLKVCMLPKKIQDVFTASTINMQNQPLYGSFRSDKKLILFYRHIADDYYGMGPFPTTTTQALVCLVYGTDLTAGASFKVTAARTFEGIPDSNLAEFLSATKEDNSSIGPTQIKSQYGHIDIPAICTRDDYDQRRAQLMGQFDERVLDSDMSDGQKFYSLYKYMKQNATFSSNYTPGAHKFIRSSAVIGETKDQETTRIKNDDVAEDAFNAEQELIKHENTPVAVSIPQPRSSLLLSAYSTVKDSANGIVDSVVNSTATIKTAASELVDLVKSSQEVYGSIVDAVKQVKSAISSIKDTNVKKTLMKSVIEGIADIPLQPLEGA